MLLKDRGLPANLNNRIPIINSLKRLNSVCLRRRKGLIGVAQISGILKENLVALSDRASEVFRGSSQIVVCALHRSCGSDASAPVFSTQRTAYFTRFPYCVDLSSPSFSNFNTKLRIVV